MYAAFNAWKEQFKANILDMDGKLKPGGKVLSASGVTDGPFVETKEVIGGFVVVAAESYGQAVEIARGCPAWLDRDCRRRFARLRAHEHVIISSQPLLDELRDVRERKFRQGASDVREAFQLFVDTFSLVTPDDLDASTCRDRDDDIALATALAGECAAIVTGGQDLLILDPFRGIRVLASSASGDGNQSTTRNGHLMARESSLESRKARL